MSVFHEIKLEQANDEAELFTDQELHPRPKAQLIELIRIAWKEAEDLPEEPGQELTARVDSAFEAICDAQNFNAELQKAHPEAGKRLRRIYRLIEEASNAVLTIGGYIQPQQYAFGSAIDSSSEATPPKSAPQGSSPKSR